MLIIIISVAAGMALSAYLILPAGFDISECSSASRQPVLDPDYTGVTVPPNIAPMNFIIREPGDRYLARISSEKGRSMEIYSAGPEIIIPMGKWKKMLRANRGGWFTIEIFVKDENGGVRRYKPVRNWIAEDKIDGHLVYRLINLGYRLWDKMGLYRRNLATFREKPVILNRMTEYNCVNCHSFHNNSPERMMFHLRANPSGTILVHDGKVTVLNTRTKMARGAVYPGWHPGGEHIAFSTNSIVQFFHAKGENRDVFDKFSNLIVYNIKTNTVTTAPEVSSPDYLENLPSWSPDGKTIYFIRAPSFDSHVRPVSESDTLKKGFRFDELKYSLMRIKYDVEKDKWGEMETLISADSTGLSVSWPRVSPDGKYLLFCMSNYGYFTIHNPETDLCMMDLKTGITRRLDKVNSGRTDSYHSWSGNSRWFVFSSKRRDGLTTRPFFCYVDKEGGTHKPFVLPQKDPRFYRTFLKCYNVPELINAPVKISPQEFARTGWKEKLVRQVKLDPKVQAPSEKATTQMPWHKARN